MTLRRFSPALVGVVAATVLAGCTVDGDPRRSTAEPSDRGPTPTVAPAPTDRSTPPSEAPTAAPQRPAEAPPQPMVSDGRPRRASMSIPALGLRDLLVVPYRGVTDDGPGTMIQDRGVAASPHGPRGGVGPGGVGNYLVTAHRTSSTAAFANLPSLRPGHRVVVRAGGVRHVYEIRRTRETSFRSPRSLTEQRAAVPGRPGATPTRAFLTLSTCATPEDHAAGNFWSDRFHNPEHRIDKIGVLVRTIGTPVG